MQRLNIIDLGSSSVRYMRVENGKVIGKRGVITRLAENKVDGYLSKGNMLVTTKVVKDFVEDAKEFGGAIYIFATASLRNSKNGQEYADFLRDVVGVEVDIVDGEQEAEIGLLGALGGKDGGVIDIGGGSTEIIVAQNKRIVYEKSMPLGGVVLKSLSDTNLENAKQIVKERVEYFGKIPNAKFVGIGGTVTSLVALVLKLKEYNAKKVHGYKLTLKKLLRAEKYLLDKSAQQIANETCVNIKRAEILPFGVVILKEIFSILNLKSIIVSESDNLEGYMLKIGGQNYEKA